MNNNKTLSKLTLNKESITRLESPELIYGGETEFEVDAVDGHTTDNGCTWILTTPAGTMISVWINCTISH